jgi:hypothetical protein
MRAARLKSSMIERICYDDEAGSLSIWFKATGRYVYEGVPAAAYEALKAARSAGAYFNQCIKGRYRCRFDPDRKRYGPRAA